VAQGGRQARLQPGEAGRAPLRPHLGLPGALLRNSQSYKELGLVEGEACRFFFLAILPWGDSSFSTAVDQALGTVGGDALMNVSVSSSLYGFIPIYNIFTYTCTNIRGIAIKFEKN
jgi:hypothetical protein